MNAQEQKAGGERWSAEVAQIYLGVSDRDMKTIMRLVDTDGDGLVTAEELDVFIEAHTYAPGEEPAEPTSVYIARAGDGHCLYVGITGARLQRIHAHKKSSEWWTEAATITLEHFDTRQEALSRERHLIRTLRAEYNVQHAVQT